MIQNKIEVLDKLYLWMENVLEKPRKELGGWSLCPFAKKARTQDKIYVSFIDWQNIHAEIKKSFIELESKEVGVLLFDPKEINSIELGYFVVNINESIMKHNYIIIPDHPDNNEILNGINTHFNEAGIILVFKLDFLNKSALFLKEKGYFYHWPKNRIKEGINWRYNNKDLSE
jgi:hypothetical protein